MTLLLHLIDSVGQPLHAAPSSKSLRTIQKNETARLHLVVRVKNEFLGELKLCAGPKDRRLHTLGELQRTLKWARADLGRLSTRHRMPR